MRANWIRSTHPQAKLFNSRLETLQQDARALALDGIPRTAAEVKRLVEVKNGIGQGIAHAGIQPTASTDFLCYFTEEIARRSKGGHPRSVEKLACILHKIQDFLAPPRDPGQSAAARAAQLAAQRLPFTELTARWLREYVTYLEARGNKDSTIQKELSFIKTIVRRAIEDEYLAVGKSPFKYLKIREVAAGPKVKLTQAQITRLEELVLPAHRYSRKAYSTQQLAREVWLLQYYLLGSRVGDVLTLRWGAVGADTVRFYEQKTNKLKVAPRHEQLNAVLARLAAMCSQQPPRPQDFVIPLSRAEAAYAQYPPALDWRLFARLPAHRATWGLLLSHIGSSTAVINGKLKEIAPMLGLATERLTTHTARHSFANMGRLAGIPAAHMRDMLNHHSVAQTEAYFGELKTEEVSEWALKIYQKPSD